MIQAFVKLNIEEHNIPIFTYETNSPYSITFLITYAFASHMRQH